MKRKLFIFILAIFSVFILTGCKNTSQNKEDFGLNSVSDAQMLKSLLRKSNNNYSDSRTGIFAENHAEAPAQEDSKDMDAPNDYTKTNVQVEGIDEGDIVKTDGNRIYTISGQFLRVAKAENGTLTILLDEVLQSQDQSKNYESYTYFSELYVTEKYLVAIGQKYTYHITYLNRNDADTGSSKDVPDSIYGSPIYYYSAPISVVLLYDKETLTKVQTFEISGYLLSSRMIDDQLYLISNYSVSNYFLNEEDFDPRPFVIDNGTEEIIDYANIKFEDNTVYQAFTLITQMKLEETITHETDTILGPYYWGTVYVSKNSIYLAYTTYQYEILGQYSEKGAVISYQFDDDGSVYYGGTGYYKGQTINQFAIDEYNGYLRMVTTEGWGSTTRNRLYVFERVLKNNSYELKVVALLEEGIGKPNERVMSVRFNNDLATVVTYEQKDPFYTIDLSDPKNPVIKGALEVPGFSSYQHPWGDHYIIGIGFNAENTWTTGMKISLYDISDITNPMEVGSPLILSSMNHSSYSYSEAAYNHKAIYVDPSHNYFGFTLNKTTWDANSYQWSNDFLVFDVDPARGQPIQIVHTVNHTAIFGYEYQYGGYYISRALRIGDYLYVISDAGISSHNLIGEFQTVNTLSFLNLQTPKDEK